MPRPVKAIPTVSKHLRIREDLIAQVELMLFSDLEGKVPYGAFQEYIEGLIMKDLLERKPILNALPNHSQEPQS